jgi:hypothetical protein
LAGSGAPSRGSRPPGSGVSTSTISNAGTSRTRASARSSRSVPFLGRERRPLSMTRSGAAARRDGSGVKRPVSMPPAPSSTARPERAVERAPERRRVRGEHDGRVAHGRGQPGSFSSTQ